MTLEDFGKINLVRTKLADIKSRIEESPRNFSFSFSSYIEYILGHPISEFSEDEIETISTEFLRLMRQKSKLTIEEVANYFASPQNTGAVILGGCAVSKQFLQEVENTPIHLHWVLWFSIELVEYAEFCGIKLPEGFVIPTNDGIYECLLPSSNTRFAYKTAATHVPSHKANANVIELCSISMP